MSANDHRLRTGRHSERHRAYLVTFLTDFRQPHFTDLRCARCVTRALHVQDGCGHTRTLAFVVMPDHVHWLFVLEGTCSLPTVVGNAKSLASRDIRRLEDLRAPFSWRAGFHDRAIRRDEDLRAVARYVVANPLRAGLVTSLREYPHWDASWLGAPDHGLLEP